MARMFPSLSDSQLRELVSRAEARFFEACRDQLPDTVSVIYSNDWLFRDGHGRVHEGETDFTVVDASSGILVVEVKGGGVAYDAGAGQWSSLDRDGRRHAIKDPFRQASREWHATLSQVTGHALWRRWTGRRLTGGHAVMLPDIDDARALEGSGRPSNIIGVGSDLRELKSWLDGVMSFYRQDGDDRLGRDGVRLVEQILCRSIQVSPILRFALEEAERERIRLTNHQAKVLRIIGGRKRAVIAGGAGTGKTLIACEKARQLARMGLRVLLLCYNRPLADVLATSLRDEAGLQVMSFHQLCDRRVRQVRELTGRDLLAEAADAYPGTSAQQRFDVQLPYALALSNEVLDDKFDAVIVDEAQDFSDEYWFAVEELLRDPGAGCLFLFMDPNQTLYKRHANLPVDDEPYFLTENCRNTAPIHEVAYTFYVGEPVDAPDLPGPAVERHVVDGDAAQAVAVVRRVRELLSDDRLKPEDIVVLVAKRPKAPFYELLQRQALPGGVVWRLETGRAPRSVLVDTVARFKGLEAPVIVLCLGDDMNDGDGTETLYVGTTRAKTLLCVVGSVEALARVG